MSRRAGDAAMADAMVEQLQRSIYCGFCRMPEMRRAWPGLAGAWPGLAGAWPGLAGAWPGLALARGPGFAGQRICPLGLIGDPGI